MDGSKSLWEGLLLILLGIASLALGFSYNKEPPLRVENVSLHDQTLHVGLSGPTEELISVAVYAGLTSGVDWEAKSSEAVQEILRRPGVELVAEGTEVQSGRVTLELPEETSDKPKRVVLIMKDDEIRVGPDITSNHFVRQRTRLTPRLYLLGFVAIAVGLIVMSGLTKSKGASVA